MRCVVDADESTGAAGSAAASGTTSIAFNSELPISTSSAGGVSVEEVGGSSSRRALLLESSGTGEAGLLFTWVAAAA